MNDGKITIYVYVWKKTKVNKQSHAQSHSIMNESLVSSGIFPLESYSGISNRIPSGLPILDSPFLYF